MKIPTSGKLRYLHLGNNNLSKVPMLISRLHNLEHLSLHKNYKIKYIGDSLIKNKKIKTLNLFFLNFKTIPSYIYNLNNLNSLTLYNIINLSDEISKLQNLQFFTHTSGVGMNRLPDGFYNLKSLRMIRISNNSINELSPNISNFKQLEQLSLYHNKLYKLPSEFDSLRNLYKLNLGWNNFKSLPKMLNSMESLKWVGMFGNPLQKSLKNDSKVFQFSWPYTTLK